MHNYNYHTLRGVVVIIMILKISLTYLKSTNLRYLDIFFIIGWI